MRSGRLALVLLSIVVLSHGLTGAVNGQSGGTPITSIPPLSVKTELPLYDQDSKILISGFIKELNPTYPVDLTLIVRDPSGNIVTIAQITPNADGTYEKTILSSGPLWKTSGDYTVDVKYEGQKADTKFAFTGGDGTVPAPKPTPEPEPEPEPEPTPVCGPGTILQNGQCVPEQRGGGCLIATAAFGTELAPQVQFLREVRDNTVLSTSSGVTFMTSFNNVYYSFSPTVADWERESPFFQQVVRTFITPMVSTLSIMTLAENGSEFDVLALGISVIALNLGMYIVAPVTVIYKINKHLKTRK